MAEALSVLATRWEVVPQQYRCACGAAWEGEAPRYRATEAAQESTCPRCVGLHVEARAAHQQTLEVRRDDARRDELLTQLAIPPLYRAATLATFDGAGVTAGQVHGTARRWVSAWPDVPRLQLWRGGVGTGKGHLLYAVARELVAAQLVAARVVKLADLIRELRASWRDPAAEAEDVVLARYRRFDWLAIDEVSAHAFRGEPKQHLYDVVDHRLEYQRPTILTSNESEAALLPLLGPALVSRVNGAGGWIDFGTADYRSRPR
jgi:DNA replication protein DnaC